VKIYVIAVCNQYRYKWWNPLTWKDIQVTLHMISAADPDAAAEAAREDTGTMHGILAVKELTADLMIEALATLGHTYQPCEEIL
jgi:hypothetical protein